jgi:adenosylcobinamide amidohydrolase
MTPRTGALADDAAPWALEFAVYEHGGRSFSLAQWRFAQPVLAVSSAPHGGGIGERAWIVNAQVPHTYERRDPDAHLAELAAHRGLAGAGVGMLTAVDVRHVKQAQDAGARADVTVGVTLPTWAAAPDERGDRERRAETPRPAGTSVGTINIVAFVPERLGPAALVNAVMTVTEAKSQALGEAGVPGTGTASDALCITCPADGPSHDFGGPRSLWGARLARAVHGAVRAGCEGAR